MLKSNSKLHIRRMFSNNIIYIVLSFSLFFSLIHSNEKLDQKRLMLITRGRKLAQTTKNQKLVH